MDVKAARINICRNGHYFYVAQGSAETCCPLCKAESVRCVDYTEGDCVDCGNLCSANAYGCNEPFPLKVE